MGGPTPTGPRNGYGVEVSSTSGGLSVLRTVNGTQTTVRFVSGAQSVSTGSAEDPGAGGGIDSAAKIWLASEPEPAAWTSTDTDTAVSDPGQLFLAFNRSGANVGAKSVMIDDLTVDAAN